MKRFTTILIAVAVLFGANSCISDLSKRVDELEETVSAVLSSVEQLESYVKAQVYVSRYEKTDNGYILYLSNNESLLVKNGESVIDGINGIDSVSINEEYVIFTLDGGKTLALPLSPKCINLEPVETEINAYDGHAVFKVVDALDPFIAAYSDSDMEVNVSEIVDGMVTISFKRGANSTGRIYATLIDNAAAGSNTNTKVIKVNFETAALSTDLSDISLSADEQSFALTFSTNCEYSIELPEWINPVTKAMTAHTENLTVSANTSLKPRTGVITVTDKATATVLGTFTVIQNNRIDNVFILNEGQWGQNNSTLSKFSLTDFKVTNDIFSIMNSKPLGDVGNDIIATEEMLIIAVNGSNIIQFCDLDGKAIAQTEGVANNRKLVTDPEGNYLYVTSYANDGYVAKIDLTSFEVVAETQVGYEPEGIAWYDGKLYVANSGGYAYLGTHDYEDSISIIDASTMEVLNTVSTGAINLGSSFIQNNMYPRYILVNSNGDYYMTPGMSFIFDCETCEVVDYFEELATYATTSGSKFYAIGSSFSYVTYAYEYTMMAVDMASGAPVVEEWGLKGLDEMTSPYGLFHTPDGRFIVTDAGDYTNRGSMTIFSENGEKIESHTLGVCPAHFAVR